MKIDVHKKLPKKVELDLKKLLQKNPKIKLIINAIAKKGGNVFLVGGAVRDLLLGLPVKDLDIEVHGLSAQELQKILKSFGIVNLVGKSFGVYRLNGLDIDWSLPRKDSSGRKPEVKIDPFMPIEDAFRRRDLTINAMGIDLINFELVDPFDGEKDLKNKKLRVTDKNLFVEDPLRFYRVMQFIGRFEMFPDKELNKICSIMNISNVSRERIEEEFKKLFLKSKKPSLAIEWLKKIKRLKDVLPEVDKTIGVKQEPKWHPEGDVYEHTKQTLDAAANLKYKDDYEKLILMWSALTHDLGKVTTTKKINGKITSYGHEIDSEILAKKMLKRITNNIDLISSVCRLVKHHMQPIQLIKGANVAAYKRLANKLAPNTNLNMLAKLFLADRLGRNPKKGKSLNKKIPDVDKFLKKAKKIKVLESIEKPILYGRDFLDFVKPGPELGELVKKAYEIQIEEGIKDKKKLKQKTLKLLEK